MTTTYLEALHNPEKDNYFFDIRCLARAEEAIANRVTHQEPPMTVVALTADRYQIMVRSEMESMAGLFTVREWSQLLHCNPTSMCCSYGYGLAESVLNSLDEADWESDPWRPLAEKLDNLSVSQRITLCDLIERFFRGVLNPSTKIFQKKFEIEGLIFAAEEK